MLLLSTFTPAACLRLLQAGLACWLLLLSAQAGATTYYVREDGGDARQCDGRSDAAYSPQAGKHCAWRHPNLALPAQGEPRLAGGDTLIIGGGSYKIGWGSPDAAGGRCAGTARFDCYLAAVPSGTAAAPTRILGQGHDRGCPKPPTLWGSERVGMVLNLEGSSHVEIGCLEITDRSDCIEFHSNRAARCERDREPYGDWASTGISARESSNVQLRDLNIHGLANRGLLAGGLRDWSLHRVRINANGWAGWDGDIGKASSNTGRITLRDVEIGWNGCGERWQTGAPWACWAQTGGGYGDGLGTAATSGQWLIEDSHIHHNTSDGIDLLYLDASPASSVTLRRVRAEANAGNQIKTTGRTLIENSVVIGNCAYFLGKFDMQPDDLCRGMGNTVSLDLIGNREAVLRHNTISGEGDCLILSSGGDASSRLQVQNNALLGQGDWRDRFQGKRDELTCLHYANQSPAKADFSGNLVWNVKHSQCPGDSLCGKPPRIAETDLGRFNPQPLPGSPLIDRARPLPQVRDDFLHRPRPVGKAPDIGAIEVQAGS